MSSASVTIDAGVLNVPPPTGTSEDAHRYVETLFNWSKLLNEPWVDIYMSACASEALFGDEPYHLRDQLTQFFKAKGIMEYAVNDIASVVNNLLQLTPHFETYFKMREVLAEQVSTTPNILQLNPGSNLRSDLTRCVVLIAILREYCRNSIPEHCLILRYAPKPTVNVRALVYELEHERNDLNAIPMPPEFFEGSILVCDDFRGLIQCLDESAIFRSSTDNLGIKTAIRVALYKSRLARQQEPEWEEIPNLRIGHRFQEIAIRICSDQTESFSERVLRAIVETLDGLNLAAVHALRTGSGGGNPQRMRGTDKAQRRNIDHAYRLHYWQCGDGVVELACIGPHDNFSIPE